MSSRQAVADVGAVEITVIANNRAGTADAAGSLEDALARAGLRAHVARAGDGADVGDIARRAARESRVLIASGGDGTVSTVAAVAVKTAATFGVIPAGTLNHFARDALPLRAITGRLEADPGFEIFRTTEATIDTLGRGISVAIDGEVMTLRPPLHIRIRAK